MGRAGGGGEVGAKRGDEAVTVGAVQPHGHLRWSKRGGRHCWRPATH